MGLSPEDEEVASQYRKMLGMGLPEGAVIQKMTMAAVPQHIQNAVLAGEESSSAVEEASTSNTPSTEGDTHRSSIATSNDGQAQRSSLRHEGSHGRSDSHNRSNHSFWEEEVVEDDDESIEEEVMDDDDGTFEEEMFDEEEYEEEVEVDSEDGIPKGQEDAEYANRIEDNESEGGGSASTDAAPEPEEFEGSNAFASSQSKAYEKETSGGDDYGNDRLMSGGNVYQPPTPGGDVDNRQTSEGDIESQEQEKVYLPQSNAPFLSNVPEKQLPSPSSCWYWILCLLLLGLIGAGAGGAYYLTTMNGDDVSVLSSLSRSIPPTMAPSLAVSTEFNAVKGECNFDGVLNPNPIDQCLCFGEITEIEDDIKDRYLYNLKYFIPDFFEEYNDDISSCSPRNQALVWISSGDDTKILKTQRAQKFALATIYASLDGTKWNNNTNWLGEQDVCSWFGVTCVQDTYVTQLELGENNLLGRLPSELSLLERLQFLMVARNKISGPIPDSLFSISSLGTVDVGFNSITGVIPPAVGSAVSLNSLNVESNAMSGRLTKSIGKASNLGYLNLKSNQFASELPEEVFDLQSMRHLDIGNNKFSGTIPEEVSELGALEVLSLGPNSFTGSIPLSISNLDKLRYLSLSGIIGLSGRIPAEFGFLLNSLEEIIISETSISGNIDTSFGRLPSLKSLDFSKNQLRSIIPSELGNLANLVKLDLGHNFLDGQIPDTIGNIQTLEQIRLNNNLLQGGIPVSFGNLSSLEIMRLEANRLEDRVADEICDLRENFLSNFVVDCPVEIKGDSGIEIFGVVCKVPECCTNCVSQ